MTKKLLKKLKMESRKAKINILPFWRFFLLWPAKFFQKFSKIEMRQNALERPRKCSDIVPRTFLAHFCHFWSSKFWAILKIFAKCDFAAFAQPTYVVQKWRSDTHLKPLQNPYQMCVQSPFLHNICFQTRGLKIAFLDLSGVHGQNQKFEKCNFSRMILV